MFHTQAYITKSDLIFTPFSSCVDFMFLELQELGLKLCSTSAAVFTTGESGLSPSKLIGEKVWAPFLTPLLPNICFLPVSAECCMENTLHGGRAWWEQRCSSDKIPVLKGLLAVLILICLEHFINHGLLGRRHGKKSGDPNDCPAHGGNHRFITSFFHVWNKTVGYYDTSFLYFSMTLIHFWLPSYFIDLYIRHTM